MQAGWRGLGRLLAAIANWQYFKPAVFVGCALPLALLAVGFFQFLAGQQDALGVDPVKTLEHQTGVDALALLFITLSVTPIRRLFGVNRVQIVRRLLGVWAFVYSLVHVCAYLALDRSCYSFAACDFGEIGTDVLERRFVFVGLTSFVILVALAVTSTGGWVRRLKRRWLVLHRLVYVAAIASVVHFAWIQKSDISEPLNWAGVLALLFGVRVYFAWRKWRPGMQPLAVWATLPGSTAPRTSLPRQVPSSDPD
jgi:sulfoxide reductase heme-binding subunit YedZ